MEVFNNIPTFRVYIDESGDEGFSFDNGSSKWFVVSAVITRKAQDMETVKLIDDVRALLNKPLRKPLHFRDLRHEHRLPLVDHIAGANLKVVSVMVYKPALSEPEKFRKNARLYFYTSRYLLERVSWYCRDHKTKHDIGNGCAEICFSNKAEIAYKNFREYLCLFKEQSSSRATSSIDWSVIDEARIVSCQPGRMMGLQIADAVASSLYYAVEKSQYGYTEDRYARILSPVTYNHNGRYIGYGLKFWPQEIERIINKGRTPTWIRDHYQ
ncbi:MAG: DUF3800 domain-containing protein [bacterium]|nr:DUF3800 domain-containing protein [bacterium]